MKIKSLLRTYWPIGILFGLVSIFACLAPVSADEHQKEVKYEAGFYYTVKEGDTLWDISQRFNDTPWQWPDLWKENKQLPNPHWIYPGERIRLYRKGDKHQYEQKAVPQVAAKAKATPVKMMPEPVVNFYNPRASLVGFIRKPPVKAVGKIFKSLDDKALISMGDLIYIRPPDDKQSSALAAGSRLTVYRTMNPTEESDSDITIGTQHFLTGVVEVTQSEPRYAIAKVIDNYRAIEIGDLLMPYKPRAPEVKVNKSTPGIKGTIISTELHDHLISSNSTAFIDKGSVDNILPGQEYTIYYQDTVPDPNDEHAPPIVLNPVDVGALLVLHTEETTSTVYITGAWEKIIPGQLIRTPDQN